MEEIFSFWVLLITFVVQIESQQFKNSNDTNVLKANKCHVLAESCKIPVLVKNTIDPYNDLNIVANNTKHFTFLKLESCKSSNYEYLLKDDCEPRKLVPNVVRSLSLFDNFTLLYAVFKPSFIGKAEFTIEDKSTHGKISSTEIFITNPDRLVDKIHNMLMSTFQAVVSIFMGLLLELNVIVKYFKVPKAIAIGFFTQYACMPLV